MTITIRDLRPLDLDTIIALNDAALPAVSEMPRAEWERMAAVIPYFRVAEVDGKIAGFLMALTPDVTYSSLNFLWFKAHYMDFVYIDRVVVAEAFRGNGVGRALYDDVTAFTFGKAPLLTCEVNSRPPNPESMAFHEAMGFNPVGEQDTDGGKKTVVLLARDLAAIRPVGAD